MDTTSIAGASALMRAGQTQQALSMSMMKQAASQQQMMANLLEKSAKQISQPSVQSGSNFSVFA